MSDFDRDQSSKCRLIGQSALNSGNFDKAIKFFEKSERLCPLPGTQELLTKARKREPPQTSASSGASTAQQRSTKKPSSGPQRSKTHGSYRPEQETIAKEINSHTDYYKILGVPRNAADNVIKKAYRKLSMKVHPDKNKAPSAELAFKNVSAAYATLIDPEKRKKYDRYGTDNPVRSYRRGGGGSQEYMDPEDIFNMFFNGGGPRFVHRQRGQRRNPHHNNVQGLGLGQLIHFLPLLMLFVMSWFSLPFDQPQQSYSFIQQNDYVYPYRTKRGIHFYVSDRTKNKMESSHYARKISNLVEQDYLRDLQGKCYSQKQEKRQMIMRAQRMRSVKKRETLLKKARSLSLSHCSTLNKLFGKKEQHWDYISGG